MIRRLLFLPALGLVGAMLAVNPVSLGAAKSIERITAFAVNMSNVGPAGGTVIDMGIERWSTDEERELLLTTLVEQGRDKLLTALQKIKPRAGYIRTSKSLGWDLQFARETMLPDGMRQIVIASDRPINFREARNQPRTADYEFMLIQIRVDKNGKGKGTWAYAAKVSFDKDKKILEIENYASEPVRLNNVEVKKVD